MNNDIDIIKKKLKKNIQFLIENQKLNSAKKLIDDYMRLDSNDIELYSIKAVCLIMENKLDYAEKIINDGLQIDCTNYDLNYNMGYLMELRKEVNNSIKYYSKAKLFNKKTDINLKRITNGINETDIMKAKIIQGTIEIANQMNTLNVGLKNLGIKSRTINYYPNYLKYDSDYQLDVRSFKNFEEADIATKNLTAKIISENDIFHFHFGTSLSLDHADLAILEEMDKKVVMQYWGSDVRLYSKAKKINPYVKVKNMDEDSIKRNLEYISKYIPNCIVDYELAEYVKGYHKNIYYSRIGIDLNKFKVIENKNNKKMLIVHAPTSPEFKGTPYILKAIEELKERYNFEFKLVVGMTHKEAIKIYEKADLIIDQILTGSHGMLSVEAMGMGKPVICWISDFMKEKYPKELPIISANPDNIKDKIEYVIKNRDMLDNIGKQGRAYVEKYHDMDVIAKNMIEIYKKL